MRIPSAFCVAFAFALAAAGAAAQDARDALRARQDALFERMLAAPDDLQAMFDYAAVSLRLEDYEAAIATLERLLVFRQDLERVRFQLGVAYFRLGSYEPARLYFEQALADPDLDADTRARVGEYLAAIDARTAPAAFSLVALAGLTYSTNANSAPADDRVVVGGVPGFLLAPGARSEDDFGVRVVIDARHAVDLGRPNADAWITDAGFFGVKYADVHAGDTAFARLRTGPRLAVGDGRSGPTLRPFVEGQYLFGDDDTIYLAGIAGAEAAVPLGRRTRAFGELSAGWFAFDDTRPGEDRASVDLVGGVRHAFGPALSASLAGRIGYDFADADWEDNLEIGLRAGAGYRYDPGLAAVDAPWSAAAYLDLRGRFHAEADPAIDPDRRRRDFDLRAGLSHVFALRDGLGVQADVETFLRESTITNFDLDAVNVTLSLRYAL